MGGRHVHDTVELRRNPGITSLWDSLTRDCAQRVRAVEVTTRPRSQKGGWMPGSGTRGSSVQDAAADGEDRRRTTPVGAEACLQVILEPQPARRRDPTVPRPWPPGPVILTHHPAPPRVLPRLCSLETPPGRRAPEAAPLAPQGLTFASWFPGSQAPAGTCTLSLWLLVP